MNLAISDFLIMSEIPIFIFNSIHRGPALGEQGNCILNFTSYRNHCFSVCRYYGFIGGLSGTVAICTLTAISIDRYYVIKYPLNMRFTNLRAKVCVAISWLYGIVFSAIPLMDIGLGTYVPEGYLTSCSYDYLTEDYNARLFIFVFCIAAWVMPLILISYCYMTILSVVMAQKKFTGGIGITTESTRHVKQTEKKKQEIRLAIVVFMVIGLWFAAWTPYTIVSLLGICGRKDLIQPFYSMIPALFCKTASCADPFVYAFTHQRFKTEIMKLFFKTNGGGSRRIWSSEGRITRWRNRLSVEQEAVNAEPEIEMVTIGNLMRPISKQIEEFHKQMIKDDEMKLKYTPYKKPWWFRPSFNDRNFSIRSIKKSFFKNVQKDEQVLDDCDHISI